MALSTYALVTLAELKESLGAEGRLDDQRLERIINRASRLVEQEVGARLVSRGTALAPLTEYHTVRSGQEIRIRLEQWPIISVTSIHEDSGRVYSAPFLLTVNTDYILSASTGEVFRVVANSGPRYWLTGWRAIKVIYRGGYADTASVPDEYKAICLEIAAGIYYQEVSKLQGVSSVQDTHGSVTRRPVMRDLSEDVQTRLLSLRLNRCPDFGPTWEAA